MPVKAAIKHKRRAQRVRTRIANQAGGRPRLSVYRSNCHITVQVIDDLKGHTVASATSQDKELKLKNGSNKAAAEAVGKLVAERVLKAGVKEVVFDRGAYQYHGRVKALGDAARAAGLAF